VQFDNHGFDFVDLKRLIPFGDLLSDFFQVPGRSNNGHLLQRGIGDNPDLIIAFFTGVLVSTTVVTIRIVAIGIIGVEFFDIRLYLVGIGIVEREVAGFIFFIVVRPVPPGL